MFGKSVQSPFWPHSPTCDQALNALVQIRQVRFHLDLRDSGLEMPNYWNAHKVNMYVPRFLVSSLFVYSHVVYCVCVFVCVCVCVRAYDQKQSRARAYASAKAAIGGLPRPALQSRRSLTLHRGTPQPSPPEAYHTFLSFSLSQNIPYIPDPFNPQSLSGHAAPPAPTDGRPRTGGTRPP
jgi:hypothetical protein